MTRRTGAEVPAVRDGGTDSRHAAGRPNASPGQSLAGGNAAVLYLQRMAGNAAVGQMLAGRGPAPPPSVLPAPPSGGVAVQRSPGEIDDRGLLLTVMSAGTSFHWHYELSELTESVVTLLRGDAKQIEAIEAQIAQALTDDAGPRHESSAYLTSAPVANDLRRDIDEWPAKRTLSRFAGRLDARATALRTTKLRFPLEQSLEASGRVRPGELGWRREVAALRGHPPVEGKTMLDAAREDRFELALNILEREAGTDPEPTGPLHTQVLAQAIWDRYSATDFAPPELAGEQLVKTHSNAFLADWLPRITSAKFVPDGFDLSAFQPKVRNDPVRRGLVDRFIKEAAPQSMQKFLLDRWASTPNLAAEEFVQVADIDKVRNELLDHLTTDFMRWAPDQPGWRGTFWSDVGQRAAFSALTTVVVAGQALQKYNAGLADRFATAGPTELTPEEYGIAKDPYGYSERVTAAASLTSSLIANLKPGDPLEQNLTAWYEAVAQTWSAGDEDARPAAGLLAVFQGLGALKQSVEAQKEAAREQISSDLDTSYDRIATIIRNEAKVADEFLKTKWVPMLKAVALEFVTKSRDDMKAALSNWPKYREETAAKFRICGHVLDDLIRKLESGEVESVELDGQQLTRDHVEQLRTAREFMVGQAEVLTDPAKAAEKQSDMEEAVEGFEKVRANIESGEYHPLDYTSAVYNEARRRLGIDWYEPYTTMSMALSRWQVARQNPFLAYAIARWQWEQRVKQLDKQFLLFIGLGLLTVASLVVPGAVGLVLTGIDIAVSIGTGVAAVSDAYDLLALARLDPDGKVRGVTVEMAEKALRTAWIGLGLSVVLSAGLAALWARLLLVGRGVSKVPAELTRLNALIKVNPVAAEKMIAKVKDLEKLEELLTLTGDSMLLERMLAKSADVNHLRYLFLHSTDAPKLMALIDKAGEAKTVAAIFDHVADFKTAERMILKSDDAGELAILVKETANPMIAEKLLNWAPTTKEANRLLSLAGDGGELSKLSDSFTPDVAAMMLSKADDAAQLNRLALRMDTGPQQLRGLLETRSAAEVEGLLNRGVRATDIEVGVGTPMIGPQPSLPTPRAAPTAEVTAVLQRYGIEGHPILQQVSAHEGNRIITVLDKNPLPKKARDALQDRAVRWAADGAADPTDFVNRWEYLRDRFVDIRKGLNPAHFPNQNLDLVAAQRLAADAGIAGLDATLAADRAAVRNMAGTGWVQVGSADVAAVKANASQLTFGSETGSAYHFRKHLDELPASAQAAAAQGTPERQFSVYLGDARRTIRDGVGAVDPTNAQNLTFTRTVTEPGGVTRTMTTRVFVRDGWALITTHGGKVQ